MGKRRRSAAADSLSEGYSSRLRPKDGLRRPDRWAYGTLQDQNGRNVTSKIGGRRKSGKRPKYLDPSQNFFSANRFTWKKRPKFLEYAAPLDGLAIVVVAAVGGGEAQAVERADCSASANFAGSSSTTPTAKLRLLPAREDGDATIFHKLQRETQATLARMYMEDAPLDLGIPSWFWGHLRPCDRFLLLKRLFIIELTPLDTAVISAIDGPEYSDARKIIKNLTQLQIVICPDAKLTNAMNLPNISAYLYEVSERIRHPRRLRKLQDAERFSVTVESRNQGRLNIFISGDSFTLKLWTDDHDFTRFVGQYRREVFPSVWAAFHASSSMEDSLSKDDDYLASKKLSIQESFHEIA